jgi:integrase
LQLGDIDWRAGEIVVRGKARFQDRLPLTVGGRGSRRLPEGRPAPLTVPGGDLDLVCALPRYPSQLITRVVYRACIRAGLAPMGGHRLRHALASEMLRQGSDLVEISQVLRHRDLATTSVYAKVDRAALRTVARPWPGAGR